MKKFITVVLFLLLPPFSWASDDEVMLNTINKSLVEYEDKNSQCIQLAKTHLVNDNLIKKIKGIDADLSITIGYLYKNSLYQCSLNELNTLMKLLFIIDTSNKNEYSLTKLRTDKIKKLLYTKVDLRLELKFQSLPDEQKTALMKISEKLTPFNMLDMYERAQIR